MILTKTTGGGTEQLLVVLGRRVFRYVENI